MVKVTLEDLKEVLIAELERVRARKEEFEVTDEEIDRTKERVNEATTMNYVSYMIILCWISRDSSVDSWILKLMMQQEECKV